MIRLGIQVIHGRPYHPQTQGKIERLHATIRTELTLHQVFADLACAQQAVDRWRTCYNTVRPHDALGMAAGRRSSTSLGMTEGATGAVAPFTILPFENRSIPRGAG